MRIPLLPIITFLYSLHGTIAAPAPIPDTTRPIDSALLTTRPIDSSQASSRPLDSSQASPLPGSADPSRCFQYREKTADGRWNYEVDRDVSRGMCDGVCGDAVKKEVAKGNIGSVSCIGLQHPVWEPSSGPREVAAANCSCNNALLNVFAENFMDALPAIGEIGCNIFMAAFNLVVQIGSLAIPGVGEAIGAGMIAGIQAAKLASYTYDATAAATGAFANWMSPCGTAHVPDDLQKVFDAMNLASTVVIPKGGFFNGKDPKWARGSGKPGDKGSPDRFKESEPAPSPTPARSDEPSRTNRPSKTGSETTEPPKTTSATESAKQCTRKNSRRSPVEPGNNNNNDNKDQDCDQDDKVTEWVILDSTIAITSTGTETCSGKNYPQACAHYYSAIRVGNAKDTFVCTDDQDGNRDDNNAVTDWSKDHNSGNVWTSFLPKSFSWRALNAPNSVLAPLKCQADEWPPAYFLPGDAAERKKAGWGQLIRYLPDKENEGAAQRWTGYCGKHDGGKGNRQRADTTKPAFRKYAGKPENQIPVNTELVRTPLDNRQVLNENKKTLTIFYDKVTITRAAFSLAFKWDDLDNGLEEPKKANDWHLKENPCWPKELVPNDPGFNILTSDDWYKAQNRDWKFPEGWKFENEVPKYRYPPNQQQLDEVNNRLAKAGDKRPNQDPPGGQQPPQQAPRVNPRRLDMDGDGRLILRDDVTNSTRRLTSDEVTRNVEIIKCADRHCNREKRQHRDDSAALVITGLPLPSKPVGVDAAPTWSPQPHITLHEAQLNRRNGLSGTVPAATAIQSG